MTYLDIMNDPLLPSTTGAASDEVNTFTHNNVDQAFNSGTSIAAGDLSSNTENMDNSWPSHANDPSGTSAYNFDFMDTSDQGYPYHDMGYLARFGFDLTAATAHSSQPGDLFLPLPTHSVDPSTPDSPNLAPQESIQVPHNPNKRVRISDFTEENILPDDERRKRSKPEKLTL
jgi:hypothetical protein